VNLRKGNYNCYSFVYLHKNKKDTMTQTQISKSSLQFLKLLAENNNRDWFNQHKTDYLNAQKNLSDFVDGLINEMNHHDVIESTSGKKSLFRIYNDVRFSKDKSPYNARFAFNLQRASKLRRGGYYMNIKPGNSFLACGFFAPNPEDLKRIRVDIEHNYKEWNKLLNKKSIKQNFGAMRGDKVLTSPKGFSIEHPAIDLLRHKQFIFRHDFKDKELTAENFLEKVNGLYKSIRPFFDYMSEVLTTNPNGELLI
jgi:uncharacterized protein (TIGR02453 family)